MDAVPHPDAPAPTSPARRPDKTASWGITLLLPGEFTQQMHQMRELGKLIYPSKPSA